MSVTKNHLNHSIAHKNKKLVELQTHIKNLSGTILSIIEFWESETFGVRIPPELLAFDERVKFYRSLFTQAQEVAKIPPKE